MRVLVAGARGALGIPLTRLLAAADRLGAKRVVTQSTGILVQIVITMWAVWRGVGKLLTDVGSNRDAHMSHAERGSGLGFVER